MRLYQTSVKEDINICNVFLHLAENYVNQVKSRAAAAAPAAFAIGRGGGGGGRRLNHVGGDGGGGNGYASMSPQVTTLRSTVEYPL